MKKFSLILALALFCSPAFAQEAAKPSADTIAEDARIAREAGDVEVSAERLALAEQMHDVWPIRTRMERALDNVAEGFPPERQAEVKATMRRSIQFNQLEEESIKAMAEIFTAEELQAMIDFYGSETGRSISAKTSDYELALRPVITRMIDKAMADMRLGTPK